MNPNEIKTKLSGVYLRALVGKLDLNIQESGREFDLQGIDYQINNNNKYGIQSILNIQLKGVSLSSKSMIQEKNSYIKYNLSRDYQNLPKPAYLIVVVFPDSKELKSWCTLTPKNLILRKCAYYIDLPQNKGWIKIPKTNILNEKTLMNLFVDHKKLKNIL